MEDRGIDGDKKKMEKKEMSNRGKRRCEIRFGQRKLTLQLACACG